MTTNLKFFYPDIPFNAASITTNISDADAVTRIKKTITGSRYDFHAVAARTDEDLWINYDLGSGVSQAASHLALADAAQLIGDTVDRVSLRGSTVSAFTPAAVTGLTAWYDATRDVTTDSNGRVSSWTDLSGNTRHLVQATEANKPVLSRGDNKENLLSYSEDFSAADWDRTSHGTITVATGSTTAPDGEATGNKFTAPNSAGQKGVFRVTPSSSQITLDDSVNLRFSVYLKRSNHDHVWVGNLGAGANYGAAVNINAGTVVGTTGLYEAPTLTSVGNGWYRILMRFALNTTAHGAQVGVWFNDGTIAAPVSQLWAGTEEIYVWGAQAQIVDRDTDYVATGAVRKPGGINGLRGIHYNGVANALASPLVLSNFVTASTKCFFIVFRGQIVGDVIRTLLGDSFGYIRLGIQTNGTVRYSNYDVTDDEVFTSAISAATTYYITARHASGSIGQKLRGEAESTTASADTGSMGGVFQVGATGGYFFSGHICELIVSNSALSSDDRATVESYLESKWSATPAHQNYNFDVTDLVGTASQDYSEVFTASSAYRHWWLQLGNSNTAGSDYRFSKSHFGTAFDFSRDPVWGRSWMAEVIDSGVRRLNYAFSFTWQGITDAKVTEFITKIGKYKDVNAVWLSTNSYHDVLGDKEAIYCTVKDYEITPESVNNNEVTIDFEEIV